MLDTQTVITFVICFIILQFVAKKVKFFQVNNEKFQANNVKVDQVKVSIVSGILALITNYYRSKNMGKSGTPDVSSSDLLPSDLPSDLSSDLSSSLVEDASKGRNITIDYEHVRS